MSDEERIDRLCCFMAQLPEPRRPPLVLPAELGIRSEDIFHHVNPRLVPEIADVLECLMQHHPAVLAAVGDVDRSLIWDSMERTPLANLATSEIMGGGEGALRAALREAAVDADKVA